MKTVAQSIEGNITGMLKESLAVLTNTMTLSLKDQVGSLLIDVKGQPKGPEPNSVSKRTYDQAVTPTTHETRGNTNIRQGSHSNATSIVPRVLENAMEE